MKRYVQIQTAEEIFKTIKMPAWYPLRDRYHGNLWIVYSPKLGRKVHLCGDLEREYWLQIEFDPNVAWFCEHPLCVRFPIDSKDIKTFFDFLIKLKNGHFSLKEIKFSKDIDPDRISDRTRMQLAAQEGWTTSVKADYEVVLETTIQENPQYLANLKQIIPYLRTCRGVFRQDYLSPLFKLLGSGRELTLGSLEDVIAPESPQNFRRLVFHLMARGELSAPLDKMPIGRNLPIKKV